jgi:hypothetical protein
MQDTVKFRENTKDQFYTKKYFKIGSKHCF